MALADVCYYLLIGGTPGSLSFHFFLYSLDLLAGSSSLPGLTVSGFKFFYA